MSFDLNPTQLCITSIQV